MKENHLLLEPSLLQCAEDGCNRTFLSYNSFKGHYNEEYLSLSLATPQAVASEPATPGNICSDLQADVCDQAGQMLNSDAKTGFLEQSTNFAAAHF